MNDIKAVLFDLDGTLTYTLHDISEAMNRALALHGLPGWEEQDYRYLVGDGARTLARRAVRDRQELAEAVLADYQAWYERHALDTSAPYPEIPELLERLERRGLQICVLSNKPHADTLNVVRHFFPQAAFARIRGQIEGVPVKPDPAGAVAIASELGLQPSEFLYLGDTATDMRCAMRAGMHPIGVLWGFREAQELLDAGAERLIDHPLALLDLLPRDPAQ